MYQENFPKASYKHACCRLEFIAGASYCKCDLVPFLCFCWLTLVLGGTQDRRPAAQTRTLGDVSEVHERLTVVKH